MEPHRSPLRCRSSLGSARVSRAPVGVSPTELVRSTVTKNGKPTARSAGRRASRPEALRYPESNCILTARDSRSELQMRDVKNLVLTGCDRSYIEQWTHSLGVHILWEELSRD